MNPGADLWPAFVGALAQGLREGWERDADARGNLAALVRDARAAWPALGIEDDAFVRHLAGVVGAAEETDLAALKAADLLLAAACAAGDDAAIAAFDGRYGPAIDQGLQRLGGDAAAADELRQQLRQRLFVGQDGPPRISAYSGRGDLEHWLRVLVARARTDAQRKRTREAGRLGSSGDLGRMEGSPLDDPEFAYLKQSSREALQTAFEAAVRELSARQRNLLRNHAIDGLTSEQIAGVYGVAASTVRRWIAEAREALWAGTRRGLGQRLGVDHREFESIVRLAHSQMDVSIRRLLTEE